MISSRIRICAALLALLAASAAGASAQTPRPLRHLVWHASVGGQVTVSASSGPSGPAENSGPMRVAASDSTGGRASVRVDVVLDVIGTLADGGLAATVSESGDRTKRPVRIDVHPGGGLGIEPGRSDEVSLEEREIALLCSPTLIPDQPLEVGTTWTDDSRDGSVKRTVTNRISAMEGNRVTLLSEEYVRGTSIGAFDRRTVRRLVYDIKTLVPIHVTLDRVGHSGSGGSLTTTVDSFEYDLAADSFASRS
jgi:hypothetical protein